jgi:hypothetical protein
MSVGRHRVAAAGQIWYGRGKAVRHPGGCVRSQAVRARPNHSVNLTRNSVPHLPGMARYAHNALPGKRVPLPRAGYLKR